VYRSTFVVVSVAVFFVVLFVVAITWRVMLLPQLSLMNICCGPKMGGRVEVSSETKNGGLGGSLVSDEASSQPPMLLTLYLVQFAWGKAATSGKQSFKDPFRHIEILSQKRARSVAAHSEKSVLFRPHAEI